MGYRGKKIVQVAFKKAHVGFPAIYLTDFATSDTLNQELNPISEIFG